MGWGIDTIVAGCPDMGAPVVARGSWPQPSGLIRETRETRTAGGSGAELTMEDELLRFVERIRRANEIRHRLEAPLMSSLNWSFGVSSGALLLGLLGMLVLSILGPLRGDLVLTLLGLSSPFFGVGLAGALSILGARCYQRAEARIAGPSRLLHLLAERGGVVRRSSSALRELRLTRADHRRLERELPLVARGDFLIAEPLLDRPLAQEAKQLERELARTGQLSSAEVVRLEREPARAYALSVLVREGRARRTRRGGALACGGFPYRS